MPGANSHGEVRRRRATTEKVVPADLRIGQLQKRPQRGETRLSFGGKEIFDSAKKFVEEMHDEALIFVPREGGLNRNTDFFERVASTAERVGAKVRILARFSKDEIGFAKKLQQKGVELRRPASREAFKLAIGIYDRRSMGLVEEVEEAGVGPDLSGFISTDVQMVEWVAAVFDMIWENGVPFEDAMAEVERGVEPPRLRVFRDRARVREVLLQQIGRSREDVLFLLPSTMAFAREKSIGAIEEINKAIDRGVHVRVLTPLTPQIEEVLLNIKGRSDLGGRLIYRNIPEAVVPDTVTVLVVDRIASLVVEEKDDSQTRFEDAIGDATFSTRNSTVLANIRFFERMWEEVELKSRLESSLQKERSSRRAAELLQDILAHDIRNYNQISKLSAELLKSNINGNAQSLDQALTALDAVIGSADSPKDVKANAEHAQHELSGNLKNMSEANIMIDAILKATEGSGRLTDKAKQLGRILSQDQLKLVPVDLNEAIKTSIALLTAAHPEKQVTTYVSIRQGARVLADDMLEEVFANIVSNAIHHSKSEDVTIGVTAEETRIEGRQELFWKISISDHGSGIPDAIKSKLFTRYLKGATGTGLGLSIVYALAVERYAGRVNVADRVGGDHTKGARIEVWLPQAS